LVRREAAARASSLENSGLESLTVTVGITRLVYYHSQQMQYRRAHLRAQAPNYKFQAPMNIQLRKGSRAGEGNEVWTNVCEQYSGMTNRRKPATAGKLR
jgi:hypothetical protein